MRKLKAIVFAILVILPSAAWADEGLWLIQDLNSALEKRMVERGLKMSAKAIYDMDSPGAGVADAVVSLGGRYSGAFVSDKGLFLTSGIPAAAFIGRLGDAGKDLLKDGFWAASEQHEIPVPGEKVYSLRRVFDVTEEFKGLESQLGDPAQASHRLEMAYAEATKLTCYAHIYWEGEKVYVCAYKVYDDVRLVAAPPAYAINPEGESGKWAWPVSRCDFSLFRVFENGQPAKIASSLLVSVDGYSKDSFAAVAGYPAATRRALSAAEYRFRNQVTRPMSALTGGKRLSILEKWIAEEPSLKAKYSSRAARLKEDLSVDAASQALENSLGLQDKKAAKDGQIQAKVGKDQAFKGRWYGLADQLDKSFSQIVPGEKDKLWREETLVKGTFAGSYLLRAASAANVKEASEIIFSAIRDTDPKVEKELLAYAISEFFTNLDLRYFGPYQRWIQDRFGYDWEAAAEYLWSRSLLSKPSVTSELESVDDVKDDSLYKFLTDSPLVIYNLSDGHNAKKDEADAAAKEYARARYWAGVRTYDPDYPDGDSTLRLSFGSADGSLTTPDMLLERAQGKSSAAWRAAIEKDFWGRWGFKVDGKKHKMATCFKINADFAGGMEGSPVLDSYGRLIGVVSGGTPEGVAAREAYFDGAGCVCVDIRFILWTIDRYARHKRVLKEFVID